MRERERDGPDGLLLGRFKVEEPKVVMILMYLCFCNNYGGLGLCNNYGGLYLCNYYGGLYL